MTVTDCDGSIIILTLFFYQFEHHELHLLFCVLLRFDDLPHPQNSPLTNQPTTRPFKSDRRRTEGRHSTSGRREGWRRTRGRIWPILSVIELGYSTSELSWVIQLWVIHFQVTFGGGLHIWPRSTPSLLQFHWWRAVS